MARASFLQHIDQATHSVNLTSEELKHRAVLTALDKAARRGVHCRIVLTKNPAWANTVAEVSAAGCFVHLVPVTQTGLCMHEKILLTHHESIIIGSQNLTTTSLFQKPRAVPCTRHHKCALGFRPRTVAANVAASRR